LPDLFGYRRQVGVSLCGYELCVASSRERVSEMFDLLEGVLFLFKVLLEQGDDVRVSTYNSLDHALDNHAPARFAPSAHWFRVLMTCPREASGATAPLARQSPRWNRHQESHGCRLGPGRPREQHRRHRGDHRERQRRRRGVRFGRCRACARSAFINCSFVISEPPTMPAACARA